MEEIFKIIFGFDPLNILLQVKYYCLRSSKKFSKEYASADRSINEKHREKKKRFLYLFLYKNKDNRMAFHMYINTWRFSFKSRINTIIGWQTILFGYYKYITFSFARLIIYLFRNRFIFCLVSYITYTYK